MKRKASSTSSELLPPNKKIKSRDKRKGSSTDLKSIPSEDEGLRIQEVTFYDNESGQLNQAPSPQNRASNVSQVHDEVKKVDKEEMPSSTLKYKCEWPEPTLPSSYNYLVARSKDHRKLLLYTLYKKYPDIKKAENIRILMRILGYDGGRGSKVYNSIELYFKRFKRYGLKYTPFSSFHRLVSQEHVLYEYDFGAEEILRS